MYNEERLSIIDELVSTTERATDVLNSDSHFVHSLIQYALPVALSLKGIRRKSTRIISELGNSYNKSSLSDKVDAGGTVKAGDRFPDVQIE